MEAASVNHWLFQGNPERYDLKDRLKPGQTESWTVTRYASRIKPSDIVWFWRAHERALYGWGEVLDPPAPADASGLRVPVVYTERFDSPIGYEAIRENSGLSNLMVLRAPQGTNFRVAEDEAVALVELVRQLGLEPPVPPSQEETPAPFVAPTDAAMQMFNPFSPVPQLTPPILQTVDVLASILNYPLPAGDRSTWPLEARMADWLAGALTATRMPDETPEASLHEAMSDPSETQDIWDAGVSLVKGEELANRFSMLLSPVLAESVDRALQIEARLATIGPDGSSLNIRPAALVAALLFSDWPAVRALLVRLRKGRRIVELRSRFLEEIRETFGDEAVAKWHPFTRLGAAELVVLNYAPDLAEGDDALGIGPDVQAFASVIASKRLTPPLSIGLFGNWGSGKSFFMGRLKAQVEALAKSARIPDPGVPEKLIDNPESDYLPNVVQIEFNAWHYVEANLWASLVTHIFDNLRIDAEDKLEELQKRRDSLLKEMNTAAKLRERMEDERKAAQKHLDKKRKRLRELQYER